LFKVQPRAHLLAEQVLVYRPGLDLALAK